MAEVDQEKNSQQVRGSEGKRQEFEEKVRELGLALHLAYEQGRGYVDSDTWKAFAMWMHADANSSALREELRQTQARVAELERENQELRDSAQVERTCATIDARRVLTAKEKP